VLRVRVNSDQVVEFHGPIMVHESVPTVNLLRFWETPASLKFSPLPVDWVLS
jgi:hypothetical protein